MAASGSALAWSVAFKHDFARVPRVHRSVGCRRVAPTSPPHRERGSTSTRAQLGSLKPIEESGDEGPSQWRVRQVYGDGKELLDQLREVAALLAEGFNKSGSTSRDLLNGLVQKVR